VKGVLFRDITTLLKDKDGYGALIDAIVESLKGRQVDLVIGPEARGFVIGSALAYALHAGFVLARKPGKLPCETLRTNTGLSTARTCSRSIRTRSSPARRWSLWTTCSRPAGTALATIQLVETGGGEVVGVRFAIEPASEFDGRTPLKGYDVQSVMQY
jgi:adenine phosphoribosyltransferase